MNKFKVGDWIKSTKFTHMRPSKVQSIYKSNGRKGDFGLKCGGTVHYASEAELWQPKEGEWCWFKDEENTIGSLTQLVGIEEDGTYYGYSSYGIPDKAPCVEPFIGELPSFLKDQN